MEDEVLIAPLRACMVILLRACMAILLALAVIIAAPDRPAAQEETDDTPLQARTKELLRAYGQTQTKDAMVTMREQLLAKADTLEAAGEDVLATHCLERAGIVCYRLAEFDRMDEICARGLEVARRSGDQKRIAALLNAQAIGISSGGDNEGAIKLQIELVTLRQELEDIRGEGVSWHNLAFSYFALFRYPEGIDAVSNAWRLHREAGNAFGLAGSMSTLANALFDVGQSANALAMADSSVFRSRGLGNVQMLGTALQTRGRQLHYAGRYDESLSDYEEAHDVLTTGGSVLSAGLNDINWANALISLDRCDEARDAIAGATETLAPIGSQAALVWGDCVQARIEARCGEVEAARDALLATIDRLEAIRDSLPEDMSRADAFRMAGGAYADLAILEIENGSPEEAWIAVESSTSRVFGEELRVGGRSTLEQLQAGLAQIDAMVLQFGYSTVDRNVVCVVTANEVIAQPVTIGAGFRNDVEAALRLMASGATDEECRLVLERITDVTLASVAEALAGTSRLVVFPGGLAGFPIEALPIPGAGGATIGDRFAVTYAPSATTFLHLQERESPGGPMIVFADPDLGSQLEDSPEIAMRSTRMSLAPLPEARAEGKAIVASGILFVGADATRSAFLERATGAGVIHVAAHAVVDGTHPEHSGIVLAGEEGGDLVTVGDLGGVTLDADLVSLSGCETAGGYIATGDGAFGLTRVFLLAGARSVVSSWWDVEDSAARRFMELYYDALRNGAVRDIALKEARETMATEGYPHRDRTAFALTGATAQPVAALAASTARPGRGVVAGGGALVVILIVLAATARRRRAATAGPSSQ
jgi:tetratricopeptide (TPR) repeat protein